jgi:hypothetical protein
MAAEDVEIATTFLLAVAAAVRTGDREPVYPLLDPDVEWVVPERTLHGIDDLREHLIWGFPPGASTSSSSPARSSISATAAFARTSVRSTGGRRRATSPTSACDGSS